MEDPTGAHTYHSEENRQAIDLCRRKLNIKKNKTNNSATRKSNLQFEAIPLTTLFLRESEVEDKFIEEIEEFKEETRERLRKLIGYQNDRKIMIELNKLEYVRYKDNTLENTKWHTKTGRMRPRTKEESKRPRYTCPVYTCLVFANDKKHVKSIRQETITTKKYLKPLNA